MEDLFYFSNCRSFPMLKSEEEFLREDFSSKRSLNVCVRKPQFSTHHRQVLVCTIEVFQLAKTCSEVISSDIFCPHACGVMFVSGRMDSRHEYVRSFGERLEKEKEENIDRLQAAICRHVCCTNDLFVHFLTVFWRNPDVKWPQACIVYKIGDLLRFIFLFSSVLN